MALGDPYASLSEFKDYLKLSGTTEYDDRLTDALLTASREVERYTNRQFNKVASASARSYVPDTRGRCLVDDFYSLSGLVVKTDESGSGTYGNTWTAADYELYPLNGIVDGQPGWPYYKFYGVGSQGFPVNCYGRKATVQVTALWGWESVPAPVKQACLILAAETYELKSAPLGVAGFGEFGVVRVRTNSMAASKLSKYVRNRLLVG